MIYCIVIIGKGSNPLFCYTEIDSGVSSYGDESLYLQTVAHSSLDAVDERKRKYVIFELI